MDPRHIEEVYLGVAYRNRNGHGLIDASGIQTSMTMTTQVYHRTPCELEYEKKKDSNKTVESHNKELARC